MTVTVMTADTTEDLVCAASGGDRHAGAELVRRHTGVVWATVRRVGLRDADAQDAVQNTWLRMFEHLAAIRDPARLPGWLATTARREALAIAQRSRRETVGLDARAADRMPDP